MRRLNQILLIFVIAGLGILAKVDEQCDDTHYVLSKCHLPEKYQWLIEVPVSRTSCEGKRVAPPKDIECDFACKKGETFDRNALNCQKCPAGKFSLGGGLQYTFSEVQDLKKTMPDLTLKSTSISDPFDTDCKKRELWKVKGNILQGDVQRECAIDLSLRFKLDRAGSISITYNLPTSYVIGIISSRCGFGIQDSDNNDEDDEDNDNDDDSKKRKEVMLQSTGYGTWRHKQISINAPGEYVLSLFTIGRNAFHFPFAIRSIVIEGHSSVQDCIPCPPGTISDKPGSGICTLCPKDSFAKNEGSSECTSCNPEKEYADEGSSKCTPRPKCGPQHYQKIFTGCDTSDVATVSYIPIQPKICIGDYTSPDATTSPCGTCNPGMFKKSGSRKCEFCPSKTYSDGTLSQCKSCNSDLSVLPGLYYKIWNELPPYLNRTYISFDDSKNLKELSHSQSWVPSINYISSQSLSDALSLLSLTIEQGFRSTEIAKATKEYGTLYFQFSVECKSTCTLSLVSEALYEDDDNYWDVIKKWTFASPTQHTEKTSYTYSIPSPDEVIFNWLFTTEDTDDITSEIRIYEINVTNTNVGGSDRCISCLTSNNEKTECKYCSPGHILSNNTCIPCLSSTVATRARPNDPVATICKPCTNNTLSEDGISCFVPCKQAFNGTNEYDLNGISTMEFHGSKLFTQKGSGYYHVFNASICGKTSVTCSKASSSKDKKRPTNQVLSDSKLCRMGVVPSKLENETSIAYTDNFGEQLVNVSLLTSKYFPALRSDYTLPDITLVYRSNTSASESACSERITFLSLRCDHTIEEEKKNSSIKYQLQTPNDCTSGTCDGCTFYFLLRTPQACPLCDANKNGFRTFTGPCKFGRQEVRKIPYPYCSHNLTETVEIRRCSILSIEIQIIIALFIIIAGILIFVVIMCWRKNRKLEYRYMQLVENTNPDDDTPVDNVCAQISDEEDSGDEVQFKKPSKAKKIMNAVRNAIRKDPHGQSDMFNRDSFLLQSTSTNDA